MPIDCTIDHARLLVVARGRGVVTDADVFAYQHDVWSRPEVTDYDELVDLTGAEAVAPGDPLESRVRELASEAAALDHPASTAKLAIVAPTPRAFVLGREYQAQRARDPRSRKQVEVFGSLAEALAFLGIDAGDLPER
jgi:hypothetical protein